MPNLREAVPGEPTQSGQAGGASGAGGRRAARALPAVSVVMPVLNEERHLAEAVAHVLGQDYPAAVEVVLAVGPSRDRTLEGARRLAAADPRITAVRDPRRPATAPLHAAHGGPLHPARARGEVH